MSDMKILSVWKKISSIIADEISVNADFAKKMTDIFAVEGSDNIIVAPKRKNRRSPAKIDPFALLEQGDNKLAEALKELTIDELKDVIATHGMDTSRLAMKWKDRNRLERHIIDTAKHKSAHGDAFWSS